MTSGLGYKLSIACQTLLESRSFLGCFRSQSCGKITLQGKDVNHDCRFCDRTLRIALGESTSSSLKGQMSDLANANMYLNHMDLPAEY